MILADTSVWVDHLRNGNADLTRHLNSSEIVIAEPFAKNISRNAFGSHGDD